MEKAKMIRRRNFALTLLKCLPMLLMSVGALSVFSFFIMNDFAQAFTEGEAIKTSARFFAFLIVHFILFVAYFYNNSSSRDCSRDYILTVILVDISFMIALALAQYVNVFAMPICLSALVLLVLFDKKSAVYSSTILCILIVLTYIFATDVDGQSILLGCISIVANLFGTMFVVHCVDKNFSRIKFLIYSFVSALFILPFVAVATLAFGDLSLNILFNALWCYVGASIGIFLFMPFVAIFEGIFNVADDFRLNELCNLNNPLLKRLASEAPGTFNHSLVVGNLAEACANAIGENPNLARCGAYYHDIGKLKAPIYYSENQSTYNPHDELIPEVSVSMITSHTTFGEILAKQYRLPQEVSEICLQHHGTSPVGYFYKKAQNLIENGALKDDNYTYPGPKPQTKIGAIVMIADTVEATFRSFAPESTSEFDIKLDRLVDEKLTLGQFDECPITMKDLNTIKSTIKEVLPSIHHSRVSYDKKK